MWGGRHVFIWSVITVGWVLAVPQVYALDYRLGVGGTLDHDIDTNHRHRQGLTLDVNGEVTWLYREVLFTRTRFTAGAGYNDFIETNGDANTIQYWIFNAAVGLALPVDDDSSLHIYGAAHSATTTQEGFEATKLGPVFGFGYTGRKYWWDVDLGPQLKSQLLLEAPDPDYNRETSSGKYSALRIGMRIRKRWAIALQQHFYDYRRLPSINTEVTGYREDFTQITFYWVGRWVTADPEPEFTP